MRKAGTPCSESGIVQSSAEDCLQSPDRTTFPAALKNKDGPLPHRVQTVKFGRAPMLAVHTKCGEANSRMRSELVERGLLFGIDLEDLIKPGDPENLQ
jgi:hypothetical protein